MLFVGCYTGANEDISLPFAAVAAGADFAIGFKGSIGCETANTWTDKFFEYYQNGFQVENAAYWAAVECSFSNNTATYRVVPE